MSLLANKKSGLQGQKQWPPKFYIKFKNTPLFRKYSQKIPFFSAFLISYNETNTQIHSFIQIQNVFKSIYIPKMNPPKNTVKPHDPILSCTHIWSTTSNPSWAPEARSETLGKPQNVPALNWILAQGSHPRPCRLWPSWKKSFSQSYFSNLRIYQPMLRKVDLISVFCC